MVEQQVAKKAVPIMTVGFFEPAAGQSWIVGAKVVYKF
jgi:hypothetical protein